MKIIEVIADSSLSGAPRHVLTLIKKLDQSEFAVYLACPDGWLAREAEKSGIKTVKIPFFGFGDFSSVLKLRKISKKINPDLIHLHGIRAGWLGVLAVFGLKQKLIYTEHLYTRDYHLKNGLREWLQLKGLSYILKVVRIILAPSEAVRDFLLKKFKLKAKKIKVVYNGLEDIASGQKRGLSPRKATACNVVRDDPRVGFIGSLNYQKGIETLLAAFKLVNRRHPEVGLEIIGNGPLKNKLLRQADGNIIFLGAQKDIKKYLAAWRFIVIPSRSESFGQTALEAFMFEKPVIVARVGGLIEVVKDGETGLFFDPNDKNELAEKIIYLFTHQDLAQAMGAKGRLSYEKFFTADKMVGTIEKIYKKVISDDLCKSSC